jgi:peptide/nickel transport system substrate-binding protein
MNTEPTLEEILREAVTRRQVLRRLGLGGLAVSAPGLLAACGGSKPTAKTQTAATGPVQQVDQITWLSGAGNTLDAAKGASALVVNIATEPIVVYDAGLKPVGHLAESFKAVDPRTYVYKVRQGVRFWDGTLLTAEDIAFAMTRHLDPKTASQFAGLIPPIDDISVTAPDEVTVRLKAPDATWQYLPAAMQVAPKKLIEEQGKDFGAPGHPIMGTGPYKITAFHPTDRIEYEANDAYWGPKPPSRKLKMITLTDAQASLLAMRAGQADGTFGVSASLLGDFRRIPGLAVTTRPSPHLAFASFDVEAKPWDDVHVRRAFAHALDKTGLVGTLLKGAGQPEESIIPRVVWGNSVPKEKLDEIYAGLPVYEFDLAKARQELAQSAYPNGLNAKLWYYAGGSPENTALVWQANLKKIGVNLKLEVAPDEVGTDREDNHHDLGFHLNDTWAGEDYPDPIDFVLNLLPSSHAKRGYYNEANYKNPAVDKLIGQNLTSLDVNARADAMAQIMKTVAEDLPYIPIWTRSDSVAISDKFVYENYTPYAGYQLWLNNIKRAA